MAAPASLAWYWNRLRLMGIGELAYRVRRTVWVRLNQRGIGLALRVPKPDTRRFGAPLCTEPPALQGAAHTLDAADRVLAGRWDVFALRDVALGFPPQWNQDPLTQTLAPMGFGKTIDYRDERVVGDSKYLWEPARHLELTLLAQAHHLSGDRKYLHGVGTLLGSWMDAAPYPLGPHWTSSLELALRLLNWSITWHLIGGHDSALFDGTDGQALRARWLDHIYRHAHFIHGHRSFHSSANNHLLGETMGLFIAGVTWPCWPESAGWQRSGFDGFVAQSLLQNSADGVNREQAIYYQHEVMDMMLICLRVGHVNGIVFPAAYLDRLERLAEFVAALMDVAGHVPMIGDADDAQLVRMSHEPDWSPYRSLLASCALLFERPDFKHKAGRLDDKTRWLFGAHALVSWDRIGAADPAHAPRMTFPEGGYYLLGTRLGQPDEVRLVADAGPLGYLSIAAHGHADALAFTLSAGGEEILIDPGTYAYHTQQAWRDHFKGTAAHNTVRVDGQDQSENGGNFMWLRKARATLLRHDTGSVVQVFEAEHDGYRRLRDPVTHRRKLELDTRTHLLTVTDCIDCLQSHEVEISWHFAEQLDVVLEHAAVPHEHVVALAKARGVSVRLSCASPQFEPTLLRGDAANTAPSPGWVARSFDSKRAAFAAVWRGTVIGPTTVVTRIEIRFGSEAERPSR